MFKWPYIGIQINQKELYKTKTCMMILKGKKNSMVYPKIFQRWLNYHWFNVSSPVRLVLVPPKGVQYSIHDHAACAGIPEKRDAGSMLSQGRRRRVNIVPTMSRRLVSAGWIHVTYTWKCYIVSGIADFTRCCPHADWINVRPTSRDLGVYCFRTVLALGLCLL